MLSINKAKPFIQLPFFIIGFGITGLVLLTITRAETAHVAFESESASIKNASVRNDAEASNNSFIEFGATTSGTTNPAYRDDTINPAYGGHDSPGIWPASAFPIPDGFPTPETAGIPADVTLTPHAGTLTITENNAVVEGLDISGVVQVKAYNVTIRNSRISGGSPWNVRGTYTDANGQYYSGLVIENSRIMGSGSCSANVVVYAGYTIKNSHVSGCADGLKAYNNTTVDGNYIAGFWKITTDCGCGEGTHNDAIQTGGATKNVVIRNNTILGSYRSSTSAFIGTGGTTDLVIENNYLSGGAYTVYPTTTANSRVIDNVFEKDSYLYGVFRTQPSINTGNRLYDPITQTYSAM